MNSVLPQSKGTSWYSSGGGGAKSKSSWSGQGYFPYFPASCPYVTAVGATMGPEYGNPEVPITGCRVGAE